jgi:hypothetical protein
MMGVVGGLVWLLSRLKYTIGAVFAAAAIPLLLARRQRPDRERLLFAAAVVVLLIRTAWRIGSGFVSWDTKFYRGAGVLALAGEDPYSVGLLNPPSSIPLFELLALGPLPVASGVWMAVNTALVVALPYLSWRVLAGAGSGSAGRTGPFPWAAAACVCVSTAAVYGLDAGQFPIVTAVFVIAAPGLRDRGWPLAAGSALALATVKVGSMLPALALFFRRRDLRVWVGLVATVTLLTAVGSPPDTWPGRARSALKNIAGTKVPGGNNDYAFNSDIHDDLVSPSRWLYCVGVRDRAVISALELGFLAVTAAWLAWRATSGRLAPDAAAAFACTFGCVFMYHRLYDTVLLTPGLIYCTAAARRESGWRRVAFGCSVVGLLAVLNMPRGWFLHNTATWSLNAGVAGRVVQAVVLPYAMWVIFGVMAVIGLASRPGEVEANREGEEVAAALAGGQTA